MTLDPISAIRENAALVLTIARTSLDQSIGFDEDGVRWLDGYIQKVRDHGDPETKSGLIDTLGSFLGECIIQTFGGEWSKDGLGWCVRLDSLNAAYPFAKVAKQLEFGAQDSVLSFFSAVPYAFGPRDPMDL